MDSGSTVNEIISRVVASIDQQMPEPFDNPYSLCRFRCAYFNVTLKPLVLHMLARHWPETA